MTRPVCKICGDDRVRRWKQARKVNGLTEAEWPKPSAPEFEDASELAQHVEQRHR